MFLIFFFSFFLVRSRLYRSLNPSWASGPHTSIQPSRLLLLTGRTQLRRPPYLALGPRGKWRSSSNHVAVPSTCALPRPYWSTKSGRWGTRHNRVGTPRVPRQSQDVARTEESLRCVAGGTRGRGGTCPPVSGVRHLRRLDEVREPGGDPRVILVPPSPSPHSGCPCGSPVCLHTTFGLVLWIPRPHLSHPHGPGPPVPVGS